MVTSTVQMFTTQVHDATCVFSFRFDARAPIGFTLELEEVIGGNQRLKRRHVLAARDRLYTQVHEALLVLGVNADAEMPEA